MISLDDDAVLLDGGIRMKWIRDAEYDPAPPMVAIDGDAQTLLTCDALGRLNVNATVNPTGDVIMKAYDDMAVLQDLQVELDPVVSRYALLVNDPRLAFSGDKLKVDAVISGVDGVHVDVYGESTGVTSGTDEIIATYTVPALKVFHMRHVMVSGTNIATYRIEVNASVIAKKRTYYTHFNEDFTFEPDNGFGTELAAGYIVTVRGIHTNILSPCDFNATISGRLEDA